jgi:hypothetical protein
LIPYIDLSINNPGVVKLQLNNQPPHEELPTSTDERSATDVDCQIFGRTNLGLS